MRFPPLLLLLLCAVSPWLRAQTDFATNFPPSLSYEENYDSFVQSDGFGRWQVGVNSKLEISAKCSMQGVDLSTIDENTEVTLTVAGLDYDDFLGSDPNYVQGNTSADIPIMDTDPDSGAYIQVGSMKISWNTTAVVFTFTVINDESLYEVEASDLNTDDEPDPDYSDEPVVTLIFGDSILDGRTLYITGSLAFSADPTGRVSEDLAKIHLIGAIDSKPPTDVAVTNPPNGSVVNTEPYTITGTAEDNNAVGSVLVQINDGDFEYAVVNVDGTTWSFPGAMFVPGKNKITVQAFDEDGNETTAKPITITYSQESTLTVQAAGDAPGKVESGYFKTVSYVSGQTSPVATALKKQGSRLTITAVPGDGALFAGWTSTGPNPLPDSSSATLNFAMTPDLVLTANFIVNPYIPLKGTYTGLIVPSDPTDFAENGFFTATLSAGGAFTGTVKIGRLTLPLQGRFGSTEQFTKTIKQGGATYVVTLSTTTDPDTGAGEITGTVTGPNSLNVTISSDQAKFQKNVNVLSPADVGSYNILLPAVQANTDQNFPPGIGYGRVTVSSLGSVQFVGKLADGTAITAGSKLSQTHIWPFYAALYGRLGSISGAITLDRTQPETDLSGTLDWLRPVGKTSTGFSGQSQLSGVLWAPAADSLVFLNPSNGAGLIDFSAPVSQPALPPITDATLSLQNVVTVTPPSSIKLSIARSTGRMTGSFLDGANKLHAFAGVVVSSPGPAPKVNSAAGLFTIGGSTGTVQFNPPP